jgi:hypothetical protein
MPGRSSEEAVGAHYYAGDRQGCRAALRAGCDVVGKEEGHEAGRPIFFFLRNSRTDLKG